MLFSMSLSHGSTFKINKMEGSDISVILSEIHVDF